MDAEQRGDLETARQSYARAMLNSYWGNLGPGAQAYTLYEYGRVSGYLCHHDEAEKYLKKSLALQDKDLKVRAELRPPTVLELARFYYDTNRKMEALPYYEEGLGLVRALDVQKLYPGQFAITLEEYADCLESMGRMADAEQARAEASSIRQNNIDSSSQEGFKRYNARCPG